MYGFSRKHALPLKTRVDSVQGVQYARGTPEARKLACLVYCVKSTKSLRACVLVLRQESGDTCRDMSGKEKSVLQFVVTALSKGQTLNYKAPPPSHLLLSGATAA